MNNHEEVLKHAIATYGRKKQILKAIEEMSELTQELCRFEFVMDTVVTRSSAEYDEIRKFSSKPVIEEMADVMIMLQQLIMIFDPEELVKERINIKIERLAGLLGVKEETK